MKQYNELYSSPDPDPDAILCWLFQSGTAVLNGFMNKVDVNGYIQQLSYTGNTQTNHMLCESFHVMLLSQSNNLFRVHVGKQKTPRGDERSLKK